ncbi:DUF6366 family protein [Evansella sp. AB-rgal1]|uniref:DUF6366 family protein n=1 Tax=Evansella sp. AB-rgal1 TaxID=3242696 RepID=UPI00359EAC52
MKREERQRLEMKEKSNNPMGNFADGVNRSMTGEPGTLAESGCLPKIIILVLIIVAYFLYRLFFN